VRARDALDAHPAHVSRQPARIIEAARFAVDGRVPTPITDAVRVAEGIRRNLMGSHKRLTSETEVSMKFSGKDRDGVPLRDHSHVSILPLDEDRDGFIDAVVIVGASPFDALELRALDRIRPVPRRNGHALVLTPVQYGSRAELLRATTVVESHTPFAPSRHWRLARDGEETPWLASQITLEAARRKLPLVTGIVRTAPPVYTRRRARWLDFQRSRKDDAPQPAYGLRLEFSEPVLAPLSLGYASHFGLGCFMPPP
jgi:CRISPR-associated protein Csb2